MTQFWQFYGSGKPIIGHQQRKTYGSTNLLISPSDKTVKSPRNAFVPSLCYKLVSNIEDYFFHFASKMDSFEADLG